MNNVTQEIARPRAEDHLAFFTEERELLEYAAALLRDAGFIHHQTSLKSEPVFYIYYKFPGRADVLRLSAHAYRKKGLKLGLDRIASALTLHFKGTTPAGPWWGRGYEKLSRVVVVRTRTNKARCMTDIRNCVASAIGYYFLNSEREEQTC